MSVNSIRTLVAVGSVTALVVAVAACEINKPIATPAPLLNSDAPNVIPGRYLVVFKNGTSTQSMAAARTLVQSLGGTIGFTYTATVKGFSAQLPPAALAAVRALPEVAHVEADKRRTFEDSQPPNPATPPAPGLDRIDQRLVPLDQTYNYSETGSGVNVYVIDSGVRISHAEFGGRASADFSVSGTPDDCRGHGTHVAAIIGGATFGVAKAVRLHSVKVGESFDCSPSDASIIAGIDWVTENRVLPAVANLSLGGPPRSQTMETSVVASILSGVTYVVAAGNAGADACNSSPGAVTAAITVGAVDPATDRRWISSNIGNCVDVFAPGLNILSASRTSDTATETKTGTSQAAPFVAGAVARQLQVVPTATPADVWTALHRINNVSTTPGWSGIADPGNRSPNELLFVQSFTVPNSDPTPPSSIALRMDLPDGRRLNATQNSNDPAAHVTAGQIIRVTASGEDLDGGLMDIQIWMTEQRWSNGVTQGPSLPGRPEASDPRPTTVGQPARVTGSVTFAFTIPTVPATQRREYVFIAKAENYHGGVLDSRGLAIDIP